MSGSRPFSLNRRGFLASTLATATLPLASRISFASAAGDSRFVTIVLRGAMDGLDLIQPHGDPDFHDLRPELALTPEQGLIDLDGFFGLHPAAQNLVPLWQGKQLAFVHAVATPYRGVGHVEAQDVLETGSTDARNLRSGWLNRALAFIPRSASRKAADITTSIELIMAGANQSDIWTTQADFPLADDEITALAALYASDAPFRDALQEALAVKPALPLFDANARAAGVAELGRLAGALLKDDYRIASFSLTGWDTHRDQKTRFAEQAAFLTNAIISLREGLGEAAWASTTVLALTEFGRTARINALGGTDHGAASVAVLAGGAVQGGKVIADWPGLGQERLFEGRALAPTGDLREVMAAMLMRQFDITPANLTSKVFPGLNFDASSRYLL